MAANYVAASYNTTTAPGAGATLVSLTSANGLIPGKYTVVIQAYFAGTAPVDGTDNDNIFITIDGVGISNQRFLMPAVAGQVFNFSFTGIVTSVTPGIRLKTIGAATAGTIYRTAMLGILQGADA